MGSYRTQERKFVSSRTSLALAELVFMRQQDRDGRAEKRSVRLNGEDPTRSQGPYSSPICWLQNHLDQARTSIFHGAHELLRELLN
jgi:hypothetical protein